MKRNKLFQIFTASLLTTMLLLGSKQASSQQPTAQQPISTQQINYAQRELTATPAIKNRLAAHRAEIQAKNLRYQVGYTSATDRSIAQLTGLIMPSDFATKARTYNLRARQLRSIDDAARDAYVKGGNTRLPELQLAPSANLKTFDWRKYGKVTGVKDQKYCGSCWDFAALAAYESSYLIRNNLSADSSEQQILDCSGAGSCKGGSHTGVFDFLIGTGDGMDADYGAYQGKEGTCQSSTNNPYRAVAWGLVTDETIPNSPNLRPPTVAELKQALVDNGPLAVCLLATPHFQDYTTDVFEEGKKAGETIYDDWTKVTYTYESNGNAYALDKNGKKFYGTNHVVLLIGWDDNTGAWLIKNSWGTNWGNPGGMGTERGYGWIKYNTDNIGHYAAWVRAKNKAYILPKDYYKVLPTIKPMPEPVVHPDPVIKVNPVTKKPSGQ